MTDPTPNGQTWVCPADERGKADGCELPWQTCDVCSPPAPPVSPPVREGRRLDVTELPEWAALVEAAERWNTCESSKQYAAMSDTAILAVRLLAAVDREDRA